MAQPASPAEGGPVKSPPAEAAAAAQPSATPVATTELAAGIVFDVLELRRMPDKGVMQLRFAVSNRTQADTSLKDLGLAYNHQLRDITVIDFGGRRQYSIGTAGRCLCSTFQNGEGGVVRAGERREFWAWFGLPPAGARQLAIQLPDQPPIDVPLS